MLLTGKVPARGLGKCHMSRSKGLDPGDREGELLISQTLTALPLIYANRSRPLSSTTSTLFPQPFPQPPVHNLPTLHTTTTYILIPTPLHLEAPPAILIRSAPIPQPHRSPTKARSRLPLASPNRHLHRPHRRPPRSHPACLSCLSPRTGRARTNRA